MPYYPQYYPQQQFYQPPMMDNLAQLRAGQYQQPMQNMQQPPQPAPQQQSMVWVSGEQEALGYLVAPNSAVALWDSNSPTIYLKQADASGKPSIKIYDLVERTNGPAEMRKGPVVEYATKQELDALSARVEALSIRETAPTKPAKKTVKEDTE
jgi:hypothetical protein